MYVFKWLKNLSGSLIMLMSSIRKGKNNVKGNKWFGHNMYAGKHFLFVFHGSFMLVDLIRYSPVPFESDPLPRIFIIGFVMNRFYLRHCLRLLQDAVTSS